MTSQHDAVSERLTYGVSRALIIVKLHSLRGGGAVNSEDLERLPYDLRRLLTVVDEKDVVSPAKPLPRVERWWRILDGPLGSLLPGGAMAVLALDTVLEQSLKRRARSERLLVKLDHAQAASLTFPPGHPRVKVVYTGHPTAWRVYVPMADFHRFLFEHKVAEAQRLLRSLGAQTITVERVQGWDQSVGVSASAGVPAADAASLKASGGRIIGHEQSVLATMQLNPTHRPHVPSDLVWMSHEPLWQEIADARISSGLRSFTLDVRSTDDYGINASLKASVTKAGFDVGGEFKEHTSTIWRMAGTFGDVLDVDRPAEAQN